MFLEIDGQEYRVDDVNDDHSRAMLDEAERRIAAGTLALNGRTVSDACEEWVATEDGTVYAVYLIVRDRYKSRTGRDLDPEKLRRIVLRRMAESAASKRRVAGEVRAPQTGLGKMVVRMMKTSS